MKVRCYWNLHKRMWSIQDAKTRRIVGHADELLLRDASFVVSEAGRDRVRREGKKNVHAFIVGTLEAAAWWTFQPGQDHVWAMEWGACLRANNAYRAAANRYGVTVTYNPYKDDGFVCLLDGHRLPVAGASPMAYLGTQRRATSRPAPSLLVFEPGLMTEAESRRATQ